MLNKEFFTQTTVVEIANRKAQVPHATFVQYDDKMSRAAPMFLMNVYFKPEFKLMNLKELLATGKDDNLRLSDDDIDFIEKLTVDQSKSWYWEKFRVGRITGSTFKKVCRTSLVKSTIMKESVIQRKRASLQWQRSMEKMGRICQNSIR